MPQHQETAAEEFLRRFGQPEEETAAEEFLRRFSQSKVGPALTEAATKTSLRIGSEVNLDLGLGDGPPSKGPVIDERLGLMAATERLNERFGTVPGTEASTQGLRDFLEGGLEQLREVHAPRTVGGFAGLASDIVGGVRKAFRQPQGSVRLDDEGNLPALEPNAVQRGLDFLSEESFKESDVGAERLAGEDASFGKRAGQIVLGELVPTGAEFIFGGKFARAKVPGLGPTSAKGGRRILTEAAKDAAAVGPIDVAATQRPQDSMAAMIEMFLAPEKFPELTENPQGIKDRLLGLGITGLNRVATAANKSRLGRAAFEMALGGAADVILRTAASGVRAGRAAARADVPKKTVVPIEDLAPTRTETAAEEFTRRFGTDEAVVPIEDLAPDRAVRPIQDLAPDVPVTRAVEQPGPESIGPEVTRAEAPGAGPAPEPPPGNQSLTQADIAALRDRLGIEAVDPVEQHSIKASWVEARQLDLQKDAIEVSQAAEASGRPLTLAEQSGAVQRTIILEDDLERALRLSEEASRDGNAEIVQRQTLLVTGIVEQLDVLTRAQYAIGSQAGLALRGRQIAGDPTLNLASNLDQGQKAKGLALTLDEVKTIEAPNTRGKKLQGEVEIELRKATEAAEVQSRVLAGIVVESEARSAARGGAGSGEKLLAERDDLLAQLSTMGQRLNDVSNVGGEGLYLIGRLAVNTIRARVLQTGEKVALSNIVDSVLRDLNNPSITVRDVHEALNARNPRAKARARSEVQKQVVELKSQARILTKIDDAEQGVFPPAGARPPRSRKIKALQKQLTKLRNAAYSTGRDSRSIERAVKTITDLQNQLTNFRRTVRRGKPTPTSELAGLQEQVRALRQEMGVEDRLLVLQDQLRTGDFRLPKPRKVSPTSPSLEAKQIALRKARRDVRAAIQAMEPTTVRGVVRASTELARTLKAMGDLSATLYQGAVLSARRPITAVRTLDKSVKVFFSQHTFDQIDNAIRNRPGALLSERAELDLSSLGRGATGEREEFFASSWAERIPALGVIVRAGNRAMTTTLNLLRTASFDQIIARHPNMTSEEMKAVASYVNIASGRGDLGRFKAVSEELSLAFFAPRTAISRVQTPFQVWRFWKLPRVRKEIAKDQAAFVATGLTVLALADLAGLEVGTDCRESDFGRIRFGDTRIDVWAGFSGPARLICRVMLGGSDAVGLTGRALTDSEKDVDPLELFTQFAQYKVSPLISVPRELYTRKTAVGEPVTPTETAVRAVLPLFLEDIVEAAMQSGDIAAVAAAVTTPLTILGVRVSTFPDSEGTVRRKIRALREEGTPEAFEEIRQMKLRHNEINPDNPIRN